MSNYRAFSALAVNANQTGSLDRAWGILRNSTATGILRLEGKTAGFLSGSTGSVYASMSIADIAAGQPFPCYVRSVEVTAGTVYILA